MAGLPVGYDDRNHYADDLGLAVDDTIHFINHGHLEFDRRGNYRDAILRSFRTIGDTNHSDQCRDMCELRYLHDFRRPLFYTHGSALRSGYRIAARGRPLRYHRVIPKVPVIRKEIETNETIN